MNLCIAARLKKIFPVGVCAFRVGIPEFLGKGLRPQWLPGDKELFRLREGGRAINQVKDDSSMVVKHDHQQVGKRVVVPKGVSVIEECLIAGNENVGNGVGQGMTGSRAGASVDTAGSPVAVDVNSVLCIKQSNVVGIAYAHAVGEVKIASLGQVTQQVVHQGELPVFLGFQERIHGGASLNFML